jgi:Fic family protein
MSEALAVLDAEITVEQETLAGIDAEIEQSRERRREQVAKLKRLMSARATLTGEKKRTASKRSPRQKAGPAAIDKIKATLADELDGRATQAAITAATGLNSGQVSAGLRALVEEGVIRETGVRVGRTKEVEIVSTRRRARAAA